MNEPSSIHVTRIDSADRDLQDTFPKGRHCVEDDCPTILTIWNPGPWCYCHAVKHQAEVAAEQELREQERAQAVSLAMGKLSPRHRTMVTMREHGMTLSQIGAHFGISRQRVSQVVRCYEAAINGREPEAWASNTRRSEARQTTAQAA